MIELPDAFVSGHPRRLAVVAGGQALSYEQLDRRSAAIARHLGRLRVGRGSFVALYVGRTVESIVALVGVLRSGAAYTLLEAGDLSRDTLTKLTSVNYAVILTTEDQLASLRAHGLEALSIEALQEAPGGEALPVSEASDPAYLLFTSGSTGVPKGVVVTRANIQHYVDAIRERLQLERSLVYAHVSTLAADLGNTGIFLSLRTGGTLHLLDDDTRKDPGEFWSYLETHRIEFLKMTPSHWRVMLDATRGAPARTPLEYLVLGGEVLSTRLASETLSSGYTRVLVNHYGPTETTIGVTLHAMHGPTAARPAQGCEVLHQAGRNSVPIGQPFGRTRLVVRDDAGVYRSRSAIGELYIGGPSVGLGYMNNAQATEERFVTGIDGPVRFYRTGDLARIADDGTVDFLGRIDRQVKVAGHRIELEHVEAVIRQLPRVQRAYVCAMPVQGRDLLVAAVLLEQAGAPAAWIKESLRAELPAHMVPTTIISLEDFPMNSNGKVDLKRVRQTVEKQVLAVGDEHAAAPVQVEDALTAEIVAVWEKYLGRRVTTLDEKFFDLGGDSITAIQVISDLQRQGYRITAKTFLQGLTVRATVAAIQSNAGAPLARQNDSRTSTGHRLSAAQKWFVDQSFAEPDRWSQAILLQVESRVDPAVLANAITDLLETHPLLRARYRKAREGWRTEIGAPDTGCFTSSVLDYGSSAEVSRHILESSREVNRRIALDGGVFRAHLFRLGGRADQLLLVCHHLSVDAVSWRVIVSDLKSLYAARARGAPVRLAAATHSLQDWVAHLEQHAELWRDDLEHWNRMFRDVAPSRPVADGAGANVEGSARTLWFGLSNEETESLEKLVSCGSMPAIVLGAFNHALARHWGMPDVVVEVESHGRKCFDDEQDISRTVGWFTSAFPLLLELHPEDVVDNVKTVERAMANVPNLGIAYGVSRDDPRLAAAARVVPPICFNYLGRFSFSGGDGLDLSPSPFRLAPVRGEKNDRVHELKLSARILDGRLIVDLSFSTERFRSEGLEQLLLGMRRALGELVPALTEGSPTIIAEDGSSTGLLTSVPHAFQLERRRSAPKTQENVFLTGATGYLGIHLLRGLLQRTKAQVHCLVRAQGRKSSWSRLSALHRWYFDGERLEEYRDRIRIVEGTLEAENFGLPQETFMNLCARLDAIYHFAADTRLFGDTAAIERRNQLSTRSAIAMASLLRAKELHYMSTLAVSGVNARASTVSFSEQCLDIGQHHQNAYEASKYRAEVMMRGFVAGGGAGFIYRAGNVTGHSRTGRFQRNAEANRLVQLLRAVVRVGRVPRELGETITLTPVDQVIDGVLAIALSGVEGGVFHVDSSSAIELRSIFSALEECGVPLKASEEGTIKDTLNRYGNHEDAVVALGMFWAGRDDRRVDYDNRWTLSLLERLGSPLDGVDSGWVRAFVQGLIERGLFDPADPSSLPATPAAATSAAE